MNTFVTRGTAYVIVAGGALVLGFAKPPTPTASPLSAPGHSPVSPAPTGFLCKSLGHEQVQLKYVVYVPRTYDAKKPSPCILFLHGMGESGIDGMKQVIQGLGSAIQWNVEAWPFIVVFPQKPDSRKQWEEYLTPVMAMLDQTKKDYSIDKARVYLTGLSQGGHGTWTFAAQRPDVWAAIAPVCGYAKPGEIAPKIKHLPVWAFHGDADSVVPAQQTRDMLAALRALGADPKESFYPGVNHNSWDKVYREENLAAWFLKHARNP